MKIIKIILIICYGIFNNLTSIFYENNNYWNSSSNSSQWSQKVTIEDNWEQTNDTGWRDYDFYGYSEIEPNRKITEMQWTAAINTEYYGWQYSALQHSTKSDDLWLKEKSIKGDNSYPFQIRVWREWWSCGNSALMLEMRINGIERRIFKFQINLWSCWKLDYSEGFKLIFQVKYEDQYQNQVDKFKNNINKNARTINTPTSNLDEKWMKDNGITTLRNEIYSDLINNVITPVFKTSQKQYKYNHIFINFSDFTKNIKFEGYINYVNVTFRPEYYYNKIYTTNDIKIKYNLNIKPEFDYYQNQINQFYQKLNNKRFNLAVASFDKNTQWIKNEKSTNIKTEIQNHLLSQIELTINELKTNFNSNNIFQGLSNFYQNLQFKHLNNKQVKVIINPQYYYQNYNRTYQTKDIINIIYNLNLDHNYLASDIDSRIKYFINNDIQNKKIIKLSINNQEKEFIAFNEKVDLEFYPLRNNDPRKSLLEEITITSSDNKLIAFEDHLIDGNAKFPWKFTTTLSERENSKNENDEVIFYNVKVLRYTTNSSGDIDKASPIEVYNKNILIKETNPGIKFLYRSIVKDQDGNAKAVSNLLPETVIYNEDLDNLIPLEFSANTKHILLDNENINHIFNSISSWMVSTKATRAEIKSKEVPFLKEIIETNSDNENKIYNFHQNGWEEWNNINKTWSGIANGYLKYNLKTVFSNNNPSYYINQIDSAVEKLLTTIAQTKENLINETDETKKDEIRAIILSLEKQLYSRITIIQNTNNINSFWNSNLGQLIKNHYRHLDQASFFKKSLQEVKILINEFLQWIKSVTFPGENDDQEQDNKDLKIMSDQEKANYLSKKIIEYFQVNNHNLIYSNQVNVIINFDEQFNLDIKKRIFSWMNYDKKAQAILKDLQTKLQLKVYNENKIISSIIISEKDINLLLKITVIYNESIAIFTPYINLKIKNGNPDDDFNKENKDNWKPEDNKDPNEKDKENKKDEDNPDPNNKDKEDKNKFEKEENHNISITNNKILILILMSILLSIILALFFILWRFKQKRKKRLVF